MRSFSRSRLRQSLLKRSSAALKVSCRPAHIMPNNSPLREGQVASWAMTLRCRHACTCIVCHQHTLCSSKLLGQLTCLMTLQPRTTGPHDDCLKHTLHVLRPVRCMLLLLLLLTFAANPAIRHHKGWLSSDQPMQCRTCCGCALQTLNLGEL